jgi:hypothetical protein
MNLDEKTIPYYPNYMPILPKRSKKDMVMLSKPWYPRYSKIAGTAGWQALEPLRIPPVPLYHFV